MKKSGFMMAASIVALMAAAPAVAAQYTGTDTSSVSATNTVSGKMKSGWTRTKQAMSNTISDTTRSHDVVKAALLPQSPGAAASPIAIDKRMTAAGMIGKPVYNQKNERVATVADVILDAQGHANMIVVKDSSFLGLGGKLAAFNYDSVIDRKKDGDVVMPITQKTIDNVAEFSYKPSDKPTVKVLPEDGYSLKKLMKGNLIDPNGKKVASIDNVTLRDGKANLVIASYDRFLGMGGDKVALDFNPGELVRDRNNNLALKLSEAQVRDFQSYKKTNK